MKILKDLKVKTISLITKNENPAVPKAENEFAIFKMFKKEKISDEQKEKIENIQKTLRKIEENLK